MSIAVMPSPSRNREIANPWPPLAPMRRAHTPRWVVRDWLALGAVSVLGVGAANLIAGALDGIASLSLLRAAFVATLVGAHRSTRPTHVYYWTAMVLARIAAVDLALLLTQQLGGASQWALLAALFTAAFLADRRAALTQRAAASPMDCTGRACCLPEPLASRLAISSDRRGAKAPRPRPSQSLLRLG